MAELLCKVFDFDGDEIDVIGKWAICPACSGHGKVDVMGCITAEDRERDWTDEEWQHYLNGAYDAQCPVCDGDGKVIVPDWVAVQDPELKKAHEAALRAIRRSHIQSWNERRNGA